MLCVPCSLIKVVMISLFFSITGPLMVTEIKSDILSTRAKVICPPIPLATSLIGAILTINSFPTVPFPKLLFFTKDINPIRVEMGVLKECVPKNVFLSMYNSKRELESTFKSKPADWLSNKLSGPTASKVKGVFLYSSDFLIPAFCPTMR